MRKTWDWTKAEGFVRQKAPYPKTCDVSLKARAVMLQNDSEKPCACAVEQSSVVKLQNDNVWPRSTAPARKTLQTLGVLSRRLSAPA